MDRNRRAAGGRITRVVLAMVLTVAGYLLVSGTAAQAVTFPYDEFREQGTKADYKIIFYGDPYQHTRKHLIVADKRTDGIGPKIRVYPKPAVPCNYVDYYDPDGNGGVAGHYDIYYEVGMIAYVYGDLRTAWSGHFGFNAGGSLLDQTC